MMPHMDDAAMVRKLLRQQAAIAHFGSFALSEPDLGTVLTEAADVCAKCLDVPFAKVCRYRPSENDLLVEAGFGWHAGVVGNVVSPADERSPQGRAFVTGKPAICNDLRKDTEFALPAFYAEHGIVSTIDVLIKGNGKPYGVLEVDSDKQRDYDEHDINFLTSFANVLAEAVATSKRVATLETAIEEKDKLLEQKRILAEELQHRVRNNLQLVSSMLMQQLKETTDEESLRGIKAIARRVVSVAEVYDHLLGSEMTRTTDFGGYIASLCKSLADIQTSAEITLTCESEPLLLDLVLDLDVVTALGIAVAELVTNSFDHAFPGGAGATNVSVKAGMPDDMATIVVSDNGTGFTANIGSKRRGLGLVHRLVQQVRGTVAMTLESGTVWTIRVPKLQPVTAALGI
jgi:two-component sensor histidine kinase